MTVVERPILFSAPGRAERNEMSDTPYTDKHVYKVTERDIGFDVLAPTIARDLERRLAAHVVYAERIREIATDALNYMTDGATKMRFLRRIADAAAKQNEI